MTERPEQPSSTDRGRTVHGEAANAGHRVLAPDDAEVEAYLETALHAPSPDRTTGDVTATTAGPVVVLDFGSQFAQLIARRVRELDVYSELLPHDISGELHMRSDAMSIAYRRRRQELLDMGWGIEADRVVGTGPRTEATVIPYPARREGDYERAWVMKEVAVQKSEATT